MSELMQSVDSIKCMAWHDVKVPPPMVANRHGGLVTAVSDTDDHGLVMILDAEKVLAETAGLYDDEHMFDEITEERKSDIAVLFVDDSAIERKQIQRTLKALGYQLIMTVNGQEAWEQLEKIVEEAELAGQSVRDCVQLVLTDIEMPKMDGYILTRKIKEDWRFNGIPVVMHSSPTTESNQTLGASVGSDDYVAKFEPRELAATLRKVLVQHGFIDEADG